MNVTLIHEDDMNRTRTIAKNLTPTKSLRERSWRSSNKSPVGRASTVTTTWMPGSRGRLTSKAHVDGQDWGVKVIHEECSVLAPEDRVTENSDGN